MTSPTLLVLYNASGSLLGHLAYGYHHIRQTDGRSCSACTLTHGPTLALSERTEWAESRGRIERGELEGLRGRGMGVKQLHTDELDETVSRSVFPKTIRNIVRWTSLMSVGIGESVHETGGAGSALYFASREECPNGVRQGRDGWVWGRSGEIPGGLGNEAWEDAG